MKLYTVILEFKKFEPFESITKEILIDLIKFNDFSTEYFGGELDNGIDYIDEETQIKIDNHSYLTLHFELPYGTNTKTSNIELIEILINIIEKYELKEIRNYDKDVEVYIF